MTKAIILVVQYSDMRYKDVLLIPIAFCILYSILDFQILSKIYISDRIVIFHGMFSSKPCILAVTKAILLVVEYSDMWYRVVPLTKAILLVTKLLIQRCVADYCSFFYLLFQFEFSNN